MSNRRATSRLATLWRAVWRPSTRYSVAALFLGGTVFGVIGWGGFNTAVEYTNRLDFCISCHEMRDTVYVEYQQSVHYKNPSGVRATCPDCHVPKDWTHKMIRKVKASNELLHKVLGTIDTPEKFEANRLAMAERVWAEMTANKSRECRNCHDYNAMEMHKQSERAREKMPDAKLKDTPCIECHKGIAHKLPIRPRDE